MGDIPLLFSRYPGIQRKTILVFLITAICLFFSACSAYPSENIDEAKIYYDEEQEYYDKKYAEEREPPEAISDLLALLETCVGGQYVIGGQGNRLTDQFLKNRHREKPGAFTKDQIEYLSRISRNGENSGWRFPEHYAWDCSGLWWWSCNELGLYPKNTDCTAYMTYHLYCTPISKDDLRPGDLVFYQNEENRIVHMGIVGRKGYVFESVCVFGGVVKKRTIEDRIYNDNANDSIITEPAWNVFGRLKIFE